MSEEVTFGARLRELRDKAKLSAMAVGAGLIAAGTWEGMDPSAARTRISNLENGRLANATREECSALERLLGAKPGELWDLALQDRRRVEPEAREYYETSIREASEQVKAAFARMQALEHHIRSVESALAAIRSKGPSNSLPNEDLFVLKDLEEELDKLMRAAADEQRHFSHVVALERSLRARGRSDDEASAAAELLNALTAMPEWLGITRSLLDLIKGLPTPEPGFAFFGQHRDPMHAEFKELREFAEMLEMLVRLDGPQRARLVRSFLAEMIGEQVLIETSQIDESPLHAVAQLRSRVWRRIEERRQAERNRAAHEGRDDTDPDEPPL